MSLKKLQEISDSKTKTRAKIRAFAKNKGRSAIGAAFRSCFSSPSKLTKIVWNQYTPHFNDGDPCVFSANAPELFIADMPLPEDDLDEDFGDAGGLDTDEIFDSYCGKREQKKLITKLSKIVGTDAILTFVEVWKALDEELLKEVFGDGVEVTVTHKSVTVTDHDHD